MNYFEIIGPVFLGNLIHAPVLLAWLVGIVLAARMLRGGGGKPEKLLITGCALMSGSILIRPFLSGLSIWLTADPEIARAKAAYTTGLLVSLPMALLSMAGIVCLILAFWFRWRTGKSTA